jgi:hypothetical protein
VADAFKKSAAERLLLRVHVMSYLFFGIRKWLDDITIILRHAAPGHEVLGDRASENLF